MKKIVIILLVLLLVTGCTKEEKTKSSNIDAKVVEHENLIVEETMQEDITNEELTTYIEKINKEVVELTSKEELTISEKSTLKNTFITLTDFILYNGKIKGKTFTELTYDAKTKIINIYEQIDSKIEEKYPGYKDEIKDTTTKTYNDIKEELTSLKEKIINDYKEEVGKEKYNEQLEEYEKNKEEIKEAVVPVIDEVIEASEEIYEAAKNSFDKWYQEWKEE